MREMLNFEKHATLCVLQTWGSTDDFVWYFESNLTKAGQVIRQHLCHGKHLRCRFTSVTQLKSFGSNPETTKKYQRGNILYNWRKHFALDVCTPFDRDQNSGEEKKVFVTSAVSLQNKNYKKKRKSQVPKPQSIHPGSSWWGRWK